MAFWRRRRPQGRHAKGAAPRPVPHVAVPPALVTFPAVPQTVPVAAPPPRVEAAPDWSFPELHPAAPTGPRVELTFRDGTSAALEGTQAQALEEIAQVLTRRD
jgi:hypothetical protein